MADPPRDWDKELAQIDKLMGSGPPAAPAPRQSDSRAVGPPVPTPGPTVRPSDLPPRGGTWPSWLRTGLAVLLAGAMTQWPYAHRCGLGMALYLGAAGVVVLAGMWGAVSSWRRRSAAAHVINLGVILAGLALVALEVAPRVGYAKTALPWMCE